MEELKCYFVDEPLSDIRARRMKRCGRDDGDAIKSRGDNIGCSKGWINLPKHQKPRRYGYPLALAHDYDTSPLP